MSFPLDVSCPFEVQRCLFFLKVWYSWSEQTLRVLTDVFMICIRDMSTLSAQYIKVVESNPKSFWSCVCAVCVRLYACVCVCVCVFVLFAGSPCTAAVPLG